jgi:hypothetical protein
LGGTGRVSKTSDNEHTAASLGHSEVLSVKHTVGPPIPEFSQRPKDGSHVPSSCARQKARDVLDENPSGSALISDTHELVEESGPFASQPSTASSHTEVLAGESSANKVNSLNVTSKGGHIVIQHSIGPVMAKHQLSRFVYLALPADIHPGPFQPEVEAADA